MTGRPRGLLGPVLIYGFAEGVSRAISFAIFPVLTHLFSSSDFGRISLLTSFAALVGLLANCGMNNAAHRYYLDRDATRESRRSVVSAGLYLLVVLSIGVFLMGSGALYLADERVLNRDAVAPALLVLMAVAPSQMVQYCQDIIRLYSTPWRYFYLVVAKTTLGLLFGIVLVIYLELGVWGYFLGLLCGALVSLPVGLVSIRADLTCRVERQIVRDMLSFGYPFIFAGFGMWVIASVDLFVITQFRGTSEAGLFSIGIRISAIIVFLTSAFSQAWSPAALSLHAQDPDYRVIVGGMLTKVGCVLLYAAAAVSFFSKDILMLLTPPEYHAASAQLAILCMSAAVLGTVQVTAMGLTFERRSDLIAKAIWSSAVVGGMLSLLLTWHFGSIGAALANLLTSLLLTSMYLWMTQRVSPLVIDYPAMKRLLLLAFVVLGAAIWLGSMDVSLDAAFIKILCFVAVLSFGHGLGLPIPKMFLR